MRISSLYNVLNGKSVYEHVSVSLSLKSQTKAQNIEAVRVDSKERKRGASQKAPT